MHASIEEIDWKAIRDRVFGRIDPLHQRAVDYRRDSGVHVHIDAARFVGRKVIQVGSGDSAERITAETIVVATGSRPVVPAIDGLTDVECCRWERGPVAWRWR